VANKGLFDARPFSVFLPLAARALLACGSSNGDPRVGEDASADSPTKGDSPGMDAPAASDAGGIGTDTGSGPDSVADAHGSDAGKDASGPPSGPPPPPGPCGAWTFIAGAIGMYDCADPSTSMCVNDTSDPSLRACSYSEGPSAVSCSLGYLVSCGSGCSALEPTCITMTYGGEPFYCCP
jgi:hypothetical protein